MAIIRVRGPSKGTSSGSSTITVTLSGTPANGNILIACIGLCPIGSGITVQSISETGVTWQKITNRVDNNGTTDTEIWAGTVVSAASTTITINLTGTNQYYSVANICEYSGLQNATPDVTATNQGNTGTTNTGTTQNTTQADELWIGATSYSSGSTGQTSPTNGFTILDGQRFNSISLAYLEKIVSSTGAANSGTVNTGAAAWSGCIATFKASGGGGGGGGGTDLNVLGNLNVVGTTTLNNKTTLNKELIMSGDVPHRTKEQIVDAIWGFNGNDWAPQELPHSPSRIVFYDTKASATNEDMKVNVMAIVSDEGGSWVAPLLAVDTGMVVQKDISCGGYVAANQGELWLGHGRKDKLDPPKIILAHADSATYGQAYDTLYLKKANNNGVNDPAHLDLQDLTAHGTIKIGNYHKMFVDGNYLMFYYSNGNNPGGFMPYDGNQVLGGNSTTGHPYAWKHIYGRWIHAADQFGCDNGTIGGFDSLDDLGIIKSVKNKRVKSEHDGIERDVVDFSNLEFLQIDKESVSINNTIGFLIGVCKFLALKVDELEAKIEKKSADKK